MPICCVKRIRRLVLLALTVVGSHAQAQPPGGPPAMPVEAQSVRADKLVVEINAVGSLIANESIMVRPEISGVVTRLHFKEGDRVAKDDVLVTLDAGEYQAQLDQSAANLKIRQLSYDRSKRLLEKNLTSQQEYDQEAALLDEARARRAVDEERLRKTQIHAPFAGTVGLQLISPGEYVKDGTDIVALSDLSSLKLDFQVPEIYLRELGVGQKVEVQVDAYPGETFSGQVYAIAPQLDVASRSVRLRARVENVRQRLRPGMFARVRLRIAERDNALLIPEEALWPIGNKQFVYRVVDGKVSMVPVTVGYRRRGDVEISDGLQVGDLVVTAGQMKIREGAAVMVINQPQSPAKE